MSRYACLTSQKEQPHFGGFSIAHFKSEFWKASRLDPFKTTRQSGMKGMMMKRLTELRQPGHVRLNMTAAQHTPEGRMLFNFYYSSSGVELLKLAPDVSGYPHNGAEHTMRISGPADDVFAWFELVRERYTSLENVQSWFEEIQKEIDAYKQEHEIATA